MNKVKNEKVEIKLTRYQPVKITLQERKKDLEDLIELCYQERRVKTKRYERRMAEINADIDKKEQELILIKEALK